MTNTPNLSRRSLRFEERDKLVLSPELVNALIVTQKNDTAVNIPHKLAVKILILISAKIQLTNLNPMQVNHLSHSLGYKQDLTITELDTGLAMILKNNEYPFKIVYEFIRNFRKIMSAPHIRSAQIKEILDLLGVPGKVKTLKRNETITILSRMVKAYCSI